MRGTWERLIRRHGLQQFDRQSLLDELLYEACRMGRSSSLRFFLAEGANPNAKIPDREFPTPFFAAIRYADQQDVSLLIRHGATAVPFHTSALGLAVWRGNVRIVKRLLALDLDPNEPVCASPGARWDVPPLLIAIAENKPGCAALLLRYGADPNVVCSELGAGFYGPMGHKRPCTPLTVARGIGSRRIVKMLERLGADSAGLTDRSYGASLNLPPELRARASCPTLRAANQIRARRPLNVVRRALERVRDLDAEDGLLLASACGAGNLQVVRDLLAVGADPNAVRKPLPELVGPHAAIARVLLDHGYNGSFQPIGSPLLDCICSGRPDLVEILLKAGVSPDIVALHDDWEQLDWTPLMTATLHDELQCMQLLLKHGADPDLGSHGFPVLAADIGALLRMSGWRLISVPPMAEPLESASRASPSGSPVQVAVMTGNFQALSMLLRHGARSPEPRAIEPYLNCLMSAISRKMRALLHGQVQRPIHGVGPLFVDPAIRGA